MTPAWRKLFVLGWLPAALLAAGPALAAPQIIALVATDTPVRLHCLGAECSAELTAYCLQEWRASPQPGTAYFLHRGAALRVSAIGADGAVVELLDPEGLRFETTRGHSAVKVSLSHPAIRRAGYKSVSLAVADDATLIPVAVAGDPKPQSERDIELAAGPLRQLGRRIVDRAGEDAAAAGILSRIISALPAQARASRDLRATVWGEAGTDDRSVGYKLARDRFELCREITEGGTYTLRQCLGSHHDILIGRLNNAYWQAAGTGM